MADNENEEVLASLVAYCKANPTMRFWQALRNWSGYSFVFVSDAGYGTLTRDKELKDTFYWTGKGPNK